MFCLTDDLVPQVYWQGHRRLYYHLDFFLAPGPWPPLDWIGGDWIGLEGISLSGLNQVYSTQIKVINL